MFQKRLKRISFYMSLVSHSHVALHCHHFLESTLNRDSCASQSKKKILFGSFAAVEMNDSLTAPNLFRHTNYKFPKTLNSTTPISDACRHVEYVASHLYRPWNIYRANIHVEEQGSIKLKLFWHQAKLSLSV